MLSKGTLERRIHEDFEQIRRRSEACLHSRSPESVHDIRTALRRVESRAEILPKGSRRSLSKYLKLCRKLFKATTKIRDSDIVIRKLSDYPDLEGSKLVHRLKEKREKSVKRTKPFARKLSNYPVKFDSSGLNDEILDKRFSKLSTRLNKRIETLLPLVIGDPRREKDLHSVRKACKELRYILEITPEEDKADGLRKWQNYLGDIHDSDVVTAWLSKQKKKKAIARVKRDVEKIRADQFRSLADSFERTPGEGLAVTTRVQSKRASSLVSSSHFPL